MRNGKLLADAFSSVFTQQFLLRWLFASVPFSNSKGTICVIPALDRPPVGLLFINLARFCLSRNPAVDHFPEAFSRTSGKKKVKFLMNTCERPLGDNR
jgi:hypothetical protein